MEAAISGRTGTVFGVSGRGENEEPVILGKAQRSINYIPFVLAEQLRITYDPMKSEIKCLLLYLDQRLTCKLKKAKKHVDLKIKKRLWLIVRWNCALYKF